MNGKISIITASYNSAGTIADTIKSVSSQTHTHTEHIIVDGGSTDKTREILRSHEDKISRFISDPDCGIYDAMNKGIALANGEIVGLLNADDVYADNTVLERVVEVFSDPAVDACYADLVYVDKNNLNKTIRYWRSCDYRDGLFAKGWVPPHPTFFVRRKIYEKYGKFDLNYPLAADFELMARFMHKHKVKSVYIPEVLIKMRLGGATNKNIANIFKQNIEIYRACKRNNIPISIIPFALTRMVTRISQFISRPNRAN